MKKGRDRIFNNILKESIKSKGIKFKAIAKGTNIKYSTLLCYLSREQAIPYYDVKSICDFIGVNDGFIYQKYIETLERMKII